MLQEYIKKYHNKNKTSTTFQHCIHYNVDIHNIVIAFMNKGLPLETKTGVYEE